MMPEVEISLVFAGIGRPLGVIDDALFSAIVLMETITTLPAPPLLKVAQNMQIVDEPAASYGGGRCID
jgi:hypothetical protein